VQALVEYDPDLVDLETDTSGSDILCSPLHLAASLSSPHSEQIINYLLDKGADLNRLDVKNRTPLWRAVRAVQFNNVKVLLEAGANPDIGDETGITPLHLAASQGQQHVCLILMSYKADPNIQDKMGDMALHHCAQVQIQRLIYNFNLNLRYPHIETFFSMLIYGNANPNIQNKEGDSPFDIIDAPLADLFDYIYKYKSNLSSHSLTLTAIIEQPPEQVAKLMCLDSSLTSTFISIFNTTREYLLAQSSDAPCTLVNSHNIPNKRKFKSHPGLATTTTNTKLPHALTQTQGFPVLIKCPVTGQTGTMPKGHSQYVERIKDKNKIPEIQSAKCPFSPNYDGDDQSETCSQQ